MEITRERFQHGSLRKLPKKDGTFSWEYRYRDKSASNKMRQRTFSSVQYRTEKQVWQALAPILAKINADIPTSLLSECSFGAIIDRYIADEGMEEIKALPPGDVQTKGLKFSSACSYLSVLNRHIRPQWGDVPLAKMRPDLIRDWLRAKDAAPKYKGHIKSLMHRLFDRAMLWGYIDVQRNPMELVEVKGISKRRKRPFILTPEQFYLVIAELPEPYHTMVLVAQCLGLRISEILPLRWSDVNFDTMTMSVTRAVVHGRIDTVKTECSEDDLPLDEKFIEALARWKRECLPTQAGWMFPNPATGQPYHASPIQQDYIAPAGRQVGLAVDIGWHTFRHTYRSLLDASGAPIGVQQKLMRHAQVATTMNVYGNALMESKREANSKVVEIVFRAG